MLILDDVLLGDNVRVLLGFVLNLRSLGPRLHQPPGRFSLLSLERGFQFLRRHRFHLIVKLEVVVVVFDVELVVEELGLVGGFGFVLLRRVHGPPPGGGEDDEGAATCAALDDGAQGEAASRVADQTRVLHAVPVSREVVEGERLQAAAAAVGARAHAVRGGDAGEGARGEHVACVLNARTTGQSTCSIGRVRARSRSSRGSRVLFNNLAPTSFEPFRPLPLPR